MIDKLILECKLNGPMSSKDALLPVFYSLTTTIDKSFTSRI